MPKLGPTPPYDELHRRFIYKPRTGELISRHRNRPVGTPNPYGYIMVTVGDVGAQRRYMAHRVIWKMMTGAEPPEEIDHRDGDITNNRWRNLRLATRSENNRNCRSKPSTSGIKGAHWHKRDKRWTSNILVSGKKVWLGYFTTPQAAARAYAKAAKSYYGSFARHD